MFKEILKTSPNYGSLPSTHKEGIEMILHKIARAICGDYNEEDHYRDIQGYAKLIEDTIINEKGLFAK